MPIKQVLVPLCTIIIEIKAAIDLYYLSQPLFVARNLVGQRCASGMRNALYELRAMTKETSGTLATQVQSNGQPHSALGIARPRSPSLSFLLKVLQFCNGAHKSTTYLISRLLTQFVFGSLHGLALVYTHN